MSAKNNKILVRRFLSSGQEFLDFIGILVFKRMLRMGIPNSYAILTYF
jgi:hypothetical protein